VSFIIFFILALVAVGCALMVVTTRSPVASALYLIVVMCSLAALFVLLGAIFLAALQVIVYAGAIMVVFLMVIMLLNLRRDEFGPDPRRIQKYLGFALAAVILVQGIIIVGWAMRAYNTELRSQIQAASPTVADTTSVAGYSSARSVAETMFTRFAYPFEVTSVLLLAAIIGAVVIARKYRADGRGEDED